MMGCVVTFVPDDSPATEPVSYTHLDVYKRQAQLLDFKVNVSTPRGYEVDEKVASSPGAISANHYQTYSDPVDACRGADLVTTDVWTSMGFESENEIRRQAFAAWRVNAAMMEAAKPDALFMHLSLIHI